MTALMAAVAQSHAVESSCPIVTREFLLLPDDKRRLFGGIDKNMSPVSEIFGTVVIEAASWEKRETHSWDVVLLAGPKTVRLRYPNNWWNPETRTTRDLILDEVTVRDQAGTVVSHVELETLDKVTLWNRPNVRVGCEGWPHYDEAGGRLDGYAVNWCHEPGWVDVSISIPSDGTYRIEVVAYQSLKVPGEESARLEMTVESDIETSRGAMAIRNKLVELHEKLLGVTVTVDSPDVEAAFQLFVEVWERERKHELRDEEPECGDGDCWIECDLADVLYFEGIADDALQYREDGSYEFNWDRVNEILREVHWWNQGRNHVVIRAWVAMLAYFLMDYRYLFL